LKKFRYLKESIRDKDYTKDYNTIESIKEIIYFIEEFEKRTFIYDFGITYNVNFNSDDNGEFMNYSNDEIFKIIDKVGAVEFSKSFIFFDTLILSQYINKMAGEANIPEFNKYNFNYIQSIFECVTYIKNNEYSSFIDLIIEHSNFTIDVIDQNIYPNFTSSDPYGGFNKICKWLDQNNIYEKVKDDVFLHAIFVRLKFWDIDVKAVDIMKRVNK
jgi:hypothetical protein